MNEQFYKTTEEIEIQPGDLIFPRGSYFYLKDQGPIILLEQCPFYPKRGAGYLLEVNRSAFMEHKDKFKPVITH